MSIREWFKRTGPEPDPKTHLLLPITQEDAAILTAMAEDWAATPEQIVHFLIREPELIEQTNREANQEECMPQPTPPTKPRHLHQPPGRCGRQPLSTYAQGGMINTPEGVDKVQLRIMVGERLIGTNGKVWEFTEMPDTDPQMYQWVRVNTDEQAAAWIARIKGRPNKFNQPEGQQCEEDPDSAGA